MLTPAFHFSILENFIEVFNEKSLMFVEKLKKEIGSEQFNIAPYITMCTLDIICGNFYWNLTKLHVSVMRARLCLCVCVKLYFDKNYKHVVNWMDAKNIIG